MRRLLLLFVGIFCFLGSPLLAQSEKYVPRQFLIQLKAKASIEMVQQRLLSYNKTLEWQSPQRLIPQMPYWKLTYSGQADDKALLRYIRSISTVELAQFNHYVHKRDKPQSTTPNDLHFTDQWQHINTGTGGGTAGVDMDTDLAWDITTGGTTTLNDTIVVAIIDDGIGLTQNDLTPNRWFNHAEIPNNNIDDDNNGYVDDYLGWNTTTQADDISGGGHGSQVAGIVGAKGNNNLGVAGVNWHVKLMIIRNDFNTTEANVLAAYGYPLVHRKRYNLTNGQEGSFVVATNASWGVDYGQAANAPLWCSFYDTLGAYGILNAGATANNNINVDQAGDLPTTCPSDYLIGVTNVNKQGKKVLSAAYGSTHIDLGAFGEGVYTARANNTYGIFGGTSGATPQVTGTIALLYAGACANFINYSRVHPDSAALRIKNYILGGVEPIVDLNGRSVSGGYLNINNSLLLCLNDCPSTSCFAPYNITTDMVIDTQAQLSWVVSNMVDQVSVRYRPQGGSWSSSTLLPLGQDSFLLNNLQACTTYEVELTAFCGGFSGESTVYTLQTDGCCEPPSHVITNNIHPDSAQLSWDNVLAANQYLIHYQAEGSSSWNALSTINTTIWLTSLQPCTYYHVYINTICQSGDTTATTDTLDFLTLGCSSCSSMNHCTSTGNNSVDDWIEQFTLDNYTNTSGNNNGYALFDTTTILLGKGDYHNISITQGKNYEEFVRIWLDINQDGDFSDANETIYQEVFSILDTTKYGSIIVPATALLGTTRMRVAMRWNRLPPVCGGYDFGETEDYCVQIIPGNSTQQLPSEIEQLQVFPNPFVAQFQLQLTLTKPSDLSLQLLNSMGQVVYEQAGRYAVGATNIPLTPKLAAGVYFLKVRTATGQYTQRVIKLN